jgi:Fanconi anemia group M protein
LARERERRTKGFDFVAGRHWIYPTNMNFRQYQFDVVKSCLYDNTLVCLPSSLRKTFISAVVMYNFYRWYPQVASLPCPPPAQGEVVFMAPTKPLVAQQFQACFRVMGIPEENMAEMTGSVAAGRRADFWARKRVFVLPHPAGG